MGRRPEQHRQLMTFAALICNIPAHDSYAALPAERVGEGLTTIVVAVASAWRGCAAISDSGWASLRPLPLAALVAALTASWYGAEMPFWLFSCLLTGVPSPPYWPRAVSKTCMGTCFHVRQLLHYEMGTSSLPHCWVLELGAGGEVFGGCIDPCVCTHSCLLYT